MDWAYVAELRLVSLEKMTEEKNELQATADRRKELLREMIEKLSFCPICSADLLDEITYKSLPHADDCRLEKELSDE